MAKRINKAHWWATVRRLQIGLENRRQIRQAADVLGALSLELTRISQRNERDAALALAASFSIRLAQAAIDDGPTAAGWYLNPNDQPEAKEE